MLQNQHISATTKLLSIVLALSRVLRESGPTLLACLAFDKYFKIVPGCTNYFSRNLIINHLVHIS